MTSVHDELGRLNALHQLEVLDTPREARFDRVIRLAQRLFDVPMAAISLVDDRRQWHKANVGLPDRESPRADAFCDRTIRNEGRPFVVPDATEDDEFRTNPQVVGGPSIRFYAGQPLAAPGGQLVGSLCILDDKPREISPLELSLLRDLADWVEKELSTDQELLHAGEVQQRLLPRSEPDLPGYEVVGRCQPARQVGGDFYDWFPVGDEFQFLVADVMGKGVAAAIIGASVRAVLRGASRFNELSEAVNRAAVTLETDLSETGTFATLFCARLSPTTGELAYVDAGHGLSFVLGPTNQVRRLISDGLPLGANFGAPLSLHRTTLAPGETLLSVSDGYLDFFPDPRSALAAVQELHVRTTSAHELVDEINALVRESTHHDDVTLVAVRRSPDHSLPDEGATRGPRSTDGA